MPLAGLERPTKFYLGALANHRGKLVDAVLAESVDAYLNRKSFTSLSDVLCTLKMSGIPTGKLRIRSASLERMIKRRHEIVHEADLVRERWPQNQAPRALSRRQVAQWISAVEGLISEIDAHWKAGKWRVSVR